MCEYFLNSENILLIPLFSLFIFEVFINSSENDCKSPPQPL